MPNKNKHHGLGKGLKALISEEIAFDDSGNLEQPEGEVNQAPEADDRLVFELSLDKIRPNKNQPRKQFDRHALDELAASIEEHGILQPLVVKPEDGGYTIIAGERRFRAAAKAGLKTVPVIIKDLPDREVVEIALIENVQREDLNPIEEAQAYDALAKTYNLTQGEIAIRIGKSRAAIANTMRLLNLPQDVRDMVLDGKLSGGHARTLLSLDDPADMSKLARQIVAHNWSVRETERQVKLLKHPKPEKKKEPRDPYIIDVEDKLRDHFQTGVKIVPKGKQGKGKIELEYYSQDDLNRLLALLK